MRKRSISIAIIGVLAILFSAVSFLQVTWRLAHSLAYGYAGAAGIIWRSFYAFLYIAVIVAVMFTLRLHQWGRRMFAALLICLLVTRNTHTFILIKTGELSIASAFCARIFPYLLLLWFFVRSRTRELFARRKEALPFLTFCVRRVIAVCVLSGASYMGIGFFSVVLLRKSIDVVFAILLLLLLVAAGFLTAGIALWGWNRRKKVLGVVLTTASSFSLLGYGGLLLPSVYESVSRNLPAITPQTTGIGIITSLAGIAAGVAFLWAQAKLDAAKQASGVS